MTDERNDPDAKTFKLQLMISPSELKAIDDWRFRKRMPTRAAAIRKLVRLGINNDDQNSTDLGRSEKA